MCKTHFLSLLILSAIFAHGIASSSKKSTEKSSGLQFRSSKKSTDDDHRIKTALENIRHAHYIVHILKNGVNICPGTILEPDLVITLASCVAESARYEVLSNFAFRKRGAPHTVVKKVTYPNTDSGTSEDGIALLKITPPINMSYSQNERVEVLRGEVLPATQPGFVSYFPSSTIEHVFPNELHENPKIQSIFRILAKPDVEQFIASAKQEL